MNAKSKKWFAALLSLALLASAALSGCTFGSSSSTTQQSQSVESGSTESGSSEGGSSSSETSQEELSEEEIKGEWQDNVYTNRYLNLQFTLPEGWNAASEEEMLEMMNLGSELLEDEASLLNELLEVKVVYNMMAADNTTGNNVILSMENLALTIGGTSIDEEAYADAVASQLTSVDSMTYTVGEYSQVEIGGNTYLKAPLTLEAEGVTLEQAYYLRRVGKYMAVLVVTDAASTGVDAMASLFTAAE